MDDYSLVSDSSSINEIEVKSKRYDYSGYVPPTGLSKQIDVVNSDIEQEAFFSNYISKRKPVVIKDLLSSKEYDVKKWKLSYLKEKAGECNVFVEDQTKSTKTNSAKSDSFGITVPKRQMKYEEFLDSLATGKEHLYMTTQELDGEEVDKFGMCTALMADPLNYLKEDFPQSPKLVQNLVPHLISIWQGSSKDGSSSGLHHDFHDNLYLMIRGNKKFRLLPPSNHEMLKMVHKPVRIYPNGLIVYSRNKYYPDLIPVRSDGVPYEFLAQTIRDKAKVELARCKREYTKMKRETASKEMMEKVQSERLEFELQMEAAEEEMYQYNGDDSDGLSNHISINDSDDEPTEKKSRLQSPAEHKSLEHFSEASLVHGAVDFDEIFANFDKRDSISCLEVSLEAGDALYIPASWFHDVTSYSKKENLDNLQSSNDEDQDPDHLALSYWFYPPDAEEFTKPYFNNFWRERLEKIRKGDADIKANAVDCGSDKDADVSEYDVIVLGSDDDDDDDDDNDDENTENDYSEGESSPWRPRSVEIDHFSEHSVESSSSSAVIISSEKQQNNVLNNGLKNTIDTAAFNKIDNLSNDNTNQINPSQDTMNPIDTSKEDNSILSTAAAIESSNNSSCKDDEGEELEMISDKILFKDSLEGNKKEVWSESTDIILEKKVDNVELLSLSSKD